MSMDDPRRLDGSGIPVGFGNVVAMMDAQVERTIAATRDRWLRAVQVGEHGRAAGLAEALEVAVAERRRRQRDRRVGRKGSTR